MVRRSKVGRYEVVLADSAERGPGLCERRFWILAPCVVLISVLTQTFDFSLTPTAYKGLFITQPYCVPQGLTGCTAYRVKLFAAYLSGSKDGRSPILTAPQVVFRWPSIRLLSNFLE